MKILVLDDEFVSRTKLKLMMEHFGVCDAVENGQDAIALFRAAHHQADPYDLIMLDINLPAMNGIEVLTLIRQTELALKLRQGRQAKILMATSYRDKHHIIASAQSGCNGYIVKPIGIDTLRTKLAKFGIRASDDCNVAAAKAPPPSAEDQLMDSIASVFDRKNIILPTIPNIQPKFHEMIMKGAVSQKLAELLRKDVAISTEIIRSSNSAYYRGFIANKSLEQSISRLGISAARQLVDDISSRQFVSMGIPKYRALIEKYWRHSIASACAAETASAALNLKLKADPFFLGLLHGIGKLALLQIIADMEHNKKLNEGMSREQLVRTIDQHHGQFGARLLGKWKYADSYVDSALFHEDLNRSQGSESGSDEKPPAELLIVNFASSMATANGYGLSGSDGSQVDLENIESTRLLNLNADVISNINKTVIEEMKAVEDLI